MARRDSAEDHYYTRLARTRQGAGALITTHDGRIVMIVTTYRDFYELPGGAVEVGETPPAACARECREELHIDLDVGRLLAIDHQTDVTPGADSVMFVYDGGQLAAEALTNRPPDAEVASIALVPPGQLDSVTIPRLAGRIRAALTARKNDSVCEAINGCPRP